MAKYICVTVPKCPPPKCPPPPKCAPAKDVAPPPPCKPVVFVTTNPCKVKFCDTKKDCSDYGAKIS